MRCFYCNKNEATRSYERVRKGKRTHEYYCADCYAKRFLDEKGAEGDQSLSACPYCDTTIADFKKSMLVGCPYCYQMLSASVFPTITRMQGTACGHRGKKLPLSEEDEKLFEKAEFVNEAERDEYRNALAHSERFVRQNRELQLLMRFEEMDGARRAEYSEKLARMKKTGKVEEEIVW